MKTDSTDKRIYDYLKKTDGMPRIVGCSKNIWDWGCFRRSKESANLFISLVVGNTNEIFPEYSTQEKVIEQFNVKFSYGDLLKLRTELDGVIKRIEKFKRDGGK